MKTPQVSLAAVAYELGEETHSFENLPRFHEQVVEYGMPEDKTMWGWGQYRRTQRKPEELALASARKTLANSGLHANDIDAVVLCAVSFPSTVNPQIDYIQSLCAELGVLNIPLFALTLNRCTTLLTGILLARSLLLSREYKNILVVSADTIVSEEMRFQPYAIFSDAAASCIVSSQITAAYEIQAGKWLGGPASNPYLPDIGAKLAKEVADQLGIAPGFDTIKHVFHDNLFIPIVTLREQMAGCPADRLFLSNISRIGHCSGSDPLINLADYESNLSISTGSSFLLACSTAGIRAVIQLIKTEVY